jgi:hypothetical protein
MTKYEYLNIIKRLSKLDLTYPAMDEDGAHYDKDQMEDIKQILKEYIDKDKGSNERKPNINFYNNRWHCACGMVIAKKDWKLGFRLCWQCREYPD